MSQRVDERPLKLETERNARRGERMVAEQEDGEEAKVAGG